MIILQKEFEELTSFCINNDGSIYEIVDTKGAVFHILYWKLDNYGLVFFKGKDFALAGIRDGVVSCHKITIEKKEKGIDITFE